MQQHVLVSQVVHMLGAEHGNFLFHALVPLLSILPYMHRALSAETVSQVANCLTR